MSPTLEAAGAGMLIALLSAVGAESLWWIFRPRTIARATACWMIGMLLRLLIALAGVGFGIGWLGLQAVPLVLSMCVGYAVVLSIETRWNVRRIGQMKTTERAMGKLPL